MTGNVNNVYNRFDPTKRYDFHQFRADKGLQSAELNELQSAMHHRLQTVGDALFKDGDIIAGSDPTLKGAVLTLPMSSIYIRGAVRLVEASTLNVSTTGTVSVGVYLQNKTITALDDPTLRDPAVGTRNFDEEGANRVQITLVWGYAGDGKDGDYFPVHTIKDGNLLQNSPPPQLDSVLQLVARYDNNANGHYVVNGMNTTYIGKRYDTELATGNFYAEGSGSVAGNVLTSSGGGWTFIAKDMATTNGKKYVVEFELDSVPDQSVYARAMKDKTDLIIASLDVADKGVKSFEFIAQSDLTQIKFQFLDNSTDDGDKLEVVSLSVREASDNGNQLFSISEGEAHVSGFEVRNINAVRLLSPVAPDTDSIVSEPHTFTDSGDGTAKITLNKAPINQVSAIRVTKRTTTNVTHGGFTGVTDALPDDSILSIVEVKQSSTTYTAGTDYNFTGDELDWSPSGSEPAPSSTYSVTYDHIVVVQPTEIGSDYVVVDTALNGTIVNVDYTWNLPRIDRIVIDQTGQTILIKGIPSRYRPKPAAIPSNVLGLASVYQSWDGNPTVANDSVRVVPMVELEAMRDDIATLFDLVAVERLRNDANISEPAAKKGVFVDPFLDDDLRDQGVQQTAAIVDGELMLAIDAEIADVSASMGDTETLNFTYEPVLVQDSATGDMKINPYQAFDPVPAKVRLNRAVDRFTEVVSVWSSPVTQRLWVWSRGRSRGSVIGSSVSTALVSKVNLGAAETLRTIDVNVEVSGFGANEEVAAIRFDGIDVTPSN